MTISRSSTLEILFYYLGKTYLLRKMTGVADSTQPRPLEQFHVVIKAVIKPVRTRCRSCDDRKIKAHNMREFEPDLTFVGSETKLLY